MAEVLAQRPLVKGARGAADQASASASDLVQFLVFRLAEDEYALDIMRVNEIIRPTNITPVRKAPEYVRGVIELRGNIVPIVDLRRRLSLPEHTPQGLPFVVIVRVEGAIVGLFVDQVVEVRRVETSQIKPTPEMTHDGEGRAPFFLGVCPVEGRLVMLLNIKRLILTRDQVPLEAWARTTPEGVLA